MVNGRCRRRGRCGRASSSICCGRRAFSPGATGRFLAASWRRSATIRAARRGSRAAPSVAGPRHRGVAGAGSGGSAAVSSAPERRTRVVGVTSADARLASGDVRDRGRTPPTTGSGGRAHAGARVARAGGRGFAYAARVRPRRVADVLDGALARRAEPTRAGRDLEGLVDACFALAALRGLTRAGRLGRAAGLAEAGRLIAGVGYADIRVPRPRAGSRGAASFTPRARRPRCASRASSARPRDGAGSGARCSSRGRSAASRSRRMGGSTLRLGSC